MPQDDDGQDDLFVPIGKALPKIKPLTPVQRRLMEAAAREEAQRTLFQHTVLAQTSLPYRDPGAGVREWRREQGALSLKIDAGEARHPDTDRPPARRAQTPRAPEPMVLRQYADADLP